MKYLPLILGLASVVVCFIVWKSSEAVLDNRYSAHLNAFTTNQVESDNAKSLVFWNNKLENSPSNSVFLKKKASVLSGLFRQTHNLKSLEEGNEILISLRERFPNDVGVLHALVSNSITRHAFKDGLEYAKEALVIGEGKYTTQLIMIDLLLENGDIDYARKELEMLGNPNRFDEQIRWVKLLDADGDLDGAIEMMEKALANARSSKKTPLITWSLSNLGDMYGHQGEIQKSYESYLSALELDPSDAHSLKGIGWIALSNDKNPAQANKIWKQLKEVSNDPSLDLLLSEAAHQMGDPLAEKAYRESFVKQTLKPSYGNMYGSYLIDLLDDQEAALALAEADLEQRAHPMTHCHYALALHHAGRSSEAVAIIETEVLGQTEEPDAYYIAGKVFQDTGSTKRAKSLLTEALEASYELGPSATSDIKTRLSQI